MVRVVWGFDDSEFSFLFSKARHFSHTSSLRIHDIIRRIVWHFISCVFVIGWFLAWDLKCGVADLDVDAGFGPVGGERGRDRWGFVEQALEGRADVTIEELRHCFACYGVEMLPSGVTDEDFALMSEESLDESIKFGIRRAVQADEDRGESAGSTVGGEVEFFLPAALARCGDRDANLELVGAVVEQTIDLPAFVLIALTFDRTLPGRCGSAADGVSDDRLKQVAGFLGGSIVDVVEPLPPEQESGQGIGVEFAKLQQAARADLLQCGKWLCAEDSLVLEPGFVHRGETREVGVGVCLRRDQTLEERFGFQSADDQVFQWLAAEEGWERLREFWEVIDESQVLNDSANQVRTAFVGKTNRLCSVSQRAGLLPDRRLGFRQSHSWSTFCFVPLMNRCLTRRVTSSRAGLIPVESVGTKLSNAPWP